MYSIVYPERCAKGLPGCTKGADGYYQSASLNFYGICRPCFEQAISVSPQAWMEIKIIWYSSTEHLSNLKGNEIS